MRGTVTAGGEAVLTVRIVGEDERSADVEAVIDTGFDGHLLLPPSVVSSLSLPRIGSARPTLADGSVVLMTVHVAEVLWHGRSRPVRVLAAKGGATLVGMALLRGSRLRVDVVPGGSVSVEEL
jgi:clan AA aspartic protease